MIKRFFCIITLFAFAICITPQINATSTVPYSYVLMEGSTATLLYSDNGNAPIRPFHSAKLMTLLLAVEAINGGVLTYETIVTTSSHANSMQGAQIWLSVGEKIKVKELILAITVGNANDACVALAEAVAGSEENFIKLMNQKSKSLGMADTIYVDSTGLSFDGVTTACDIAILASELTKYPELTEYFNTWIAYVRNGTQLVNTNRLIRSYDGLTGMKTYYSEDCLNCVIATANRNDMTMVCVIIGEPDEFERFSTAKEKLNAGFSAYMLYTPKPEKLICEPVNISKGIMPSVKTELGEIKSFIIRKSQLDMLESYSIYNNELIAPINKGDKVGEFVFASDGIELFSVPIVAFEKVEKLDFFSAFLKLLQVVFTL